MVLLMHSFLVQFLFFPELIIALFSAFAWFSMILHHFSLKLANELLKTLPNMVKLIR